MENIINAILNELTFLIPIFISAVLGFLIGFERKQRYKEAGIRTHSMVCMGSALIMLVSKYAFSNSGDFDASRIAAQIVTGIGFLGAGIIVYRKNAVHGLTTAAGVWTTAGIGMAAGGGLYVLAVGATLLIVAVQYLLHMNCKLFAAKQIYRLKIHFKNDNNEANLVKSLFEVEHFHQVHIEKDTNGITCDVTIDTQMMYSSERLNKIMKENPFILSILRIEEDWEI